MTNTPLNPDALRVATVAAHDAVDWQMYDVTKFDLEDSVDVATIAAVSAYLAAAQPVVNSVEELDALPPHTVIEEHEQGHGVLIKRGPRSWECLTHYVSGLPSGDIDLPARVLYRPTEELTNGSK